MTDPIQFVLDHPWLRHSAAVIIIIMGIISIKNMIMDIRKFFSHPDPTVPTKYKQTDTIITGVQFLGKLTEGMCPNAVCTRFDYDGQGVMKHPHVHTKYGYSRVMSGDWVVWDDDGMVWTVDQEVFRRNFRPA